MSIKYMGRWKIYTGTYHFNAKGNNITVAFIFFQSLCFNEHFQFHAKKCHGVTAKHDIFNLILKLQANDELFSWCKSGGYMSTQ